jgi:probable F420-dependent oxidoreductase
MEIGLNVRNMGPQSTRGLLVDCAHAAEQAGIDHLWVADHIAIPPDQAEGSGGRYLDPLATLSFLAAVTDRIRLGAGVLVLPYRPPFATAKWVATIQELSGGRFLFGVGAGWMKAEFKIVGAPLERRGAITDETLEFVHRCFAADEVEEMGQRFLFLPRPKRPPIYVGGAGPAVLRRAARFGDGWMPIGGDPAKLAPSIGELTKLFADAGKPAPEVIAVTTLPLEDPEKATDRARALVQAGVTALVHTSRYGTAAEFARNAEILTTRIRPELERR